MENKEPKYMSLSEKEFLRKIEKGREILKNCTLCGNMCRVNRNRGGLGVCKIDASTKISSTSIHHGEEPPISGSKGSGTVFMTGCCLSCSFCQNFPISQFDHGVVVDSQEFAKRLVNLEKRGVHNINFVAPTHQVPQIIEGIFEAKTMGLTVPIVYNTGGYDSLDCLDLLNGIVDVYLPDFKYAEDETAKKFSKVLKYVEIARQAIRVMFDQVGNLKCNDKGLAESGIILRHLILPEGHAKTKDVFKIIREFMPFDVHIALMGQYFPAYKAKEVGLENRVSKEQYEKAIEEVAALGFKNIFKQEIDIDIDARAINAEII